MTTKRSKTEISLLPQKSIERKIIFIRNAKIILDIDLAELYGVSTSRLNEQVKRNIERFPPDFMFQLTQQEYTTLRSQIAISKIKRGGRRYLPYAFTEQGIAMVSSVLKNQRAVQVNIQIMRTFVKLCEIMLSHKDLSLKIETLERKFKEHDENFVVVFEAIKQLLKPPSKSRKTIGFHTR